MAELGNSEASSPGSSGDKEFEPSVDMMVNDFDDEHTMEEEEAMEEAEEQQNELSNLQKEQHMPLEDILAMYGCEDGEQDNTQSSSSEEILSNQDLTLDKDEIARDLLGGMEGEQKDPGGEEEEEEVEKSEGEESSPPGPPIKNSHSQLNVLFDQDPLQSMNTARHLRSGSHQHSDDEMEEEYDFSPDEEEDWRKTIMVGSDYQASIPEGLCKYDDALPYENEDKLLWDPNEIGLAEVERYLVQCTEHPTVTNPDTSTALNILPRGVHTRDDEQALYLLLQCGHNTDEALRRWRMNAISQSDTMSLWSEEECRNFENGLQKYGKNFHAIQQNKVRTRSVGELVQFYYLWKKTERHDMFANRVRLEKKKYNLHPGTTDYMDRFLDEQENPTIMRDRSSSPNIHSLIYCDPKRHRHHEGHVSSNGELPPSDLLESMGVQSDHVSLSGHPSMSPRPVVSTDSSVPPTYHTDKPPLEDIPPLGKIDSDSLHNLIMIASNASSLQDPLKVTEASSEGPSECAVNNNGNTDTFKNVEMSIASATVAPSPILSSSDKLPLTKTTESVAQ